MIIKNVSGVSQVLWIPRPVLHNVQESWDALGPLPLVIAIVIMQLYLNIEEGTCVQGGGGQHRQVLLCAVAEFGLTTVHYAL